MFFWNHAFAGRQDAWSKGPPSPWEVQNCLRPAAQVCRASLERKLEVAAELPAPWGELKTWLDAWLRFAYESFIS